MQLVFRGLLVLGGISSFNCEIMQRSGRTRDEAEIRLSNTIEQFARNPFSRLRDFRQPIRVPGEDWGEYLKEPLHEDLLSDIHKRCDADKDEKMTKEEVVKAAKEFMALDASRLFIEYDTDQDGKISMKESLHSSEAAKADKHWEGKFKVADKNGDGALDPKEATAIFWNGERDGEGDKAVVEYDCKSMISDLDKNDDGKLDRMEFFNFKAKTKEEKKAFTDLDADGNGFLDSAELYPWVSGRYEFNQGADKLFKVADKDSNGIIYELEFRKAKDDLTECARWEDGNPAQLFLLRYFAQEIFPGDFAEPAVPNTMTSDDYEIFPGDMMKEIERDPNLKKEKSIVTNRAEGDSKYAGTMDWGSGDKDKK